MQALKGGSSGGGGTEGGAAGGGGCEELALQELNLANLSVSEQGKSVVASCWGG